MSPEFQQQREEDHNVEQSALLALERAITENTNKREIAVLHERCAAQLLEKGFPDLEKAQEHLDNALSVWSSYNQPDRMARTWFLKGCCSGKAGDYAEAAASFECAQKLAEQADDAKLAVSVIINRTICEIHGGDARVVATRARRAFVMAQAEGDLQVTLLAHIIRAMSYQMAGNFLAACKEHEAAAKLIADGDILPPEPQLALSMDINRGISILRSGNPERAVAPFERALSTARRGDVHGQASLTLARCLFHAGEARRQARELTGACALLEEAAAIVATKTAEASWINSSDRTEWAALAMEVASSKGLCTLQEGASGFRIEEAVIDSGAPYAGAVRPRGQGEEAVSIENNDKKDGVDDDSDEGKEDEGRRVERERPGWRERGAQSHSTAEEAATIIAAGARAGEAGETHPVQQAKCAILEGVAWSLAERGSTDGAAALKRADLILESILEREKGGSTSPDVGVAPVAMPEIVSPGGPADSDDSDGQLSALRLGLICSQGLVARGGLGLGPACTTGAAKTPATVEKTMAGAAGALASIAANRAATEATHSGWATAAQLVEKQLVYAGQVSNDSARQLSVAHAHAGAIDFMTGRSKEATEHFELQRVEAGKASDVALEALAERNLADAGEAEGDLRRALRHLRRCRALAQRGRNAALEADACRRLSSVYTEIAASASLESESSAKETEHGHGDGTVEDVLESPISETQVEEKEDNDIDFLVKTAADRARLFAQRHETAVVGLQWPMSGRFA